MIRLAAEKLVNLSCVPALLINRSMATKVTLNSATMCRLAAGNGQIHCLVKARVLQKTGVFCEILNAPSQFDTSRM